MPGLKKLKKKRKFNYGRDRSRVRKQQEKTTKFNVKVDCQAMKDVWDNRVSLKQNLTKMGVAVDANAVMPKISTKKEMVKKMKQQRGVAAEETEEEARAKSGVVTRLEKEAEFVAKQTFRFTGTQVQLLTHLMDAHGEDWAAMARDPRNHYQETPAKLRGMVAKFVSIPEHYAVYCRERGLITAEEQVDEDEEGMEEEEKEEQLEEEGEEQLESGSEEEVDS